MAIFWYLLSVFSIIRSKKEIGDKNFSLRSLNFYMSGYLILLLIPLKWVLFPECWAGVLPHCSRIDWVAKTEWGSLDEQQSEGKKRPETVA